MQCPKCSVEVDDKDRVRGECINCGIIFQRYLERMERQAREDSVRADNPDYGRYEEKNRDWSAIPSVLFLLGMLWAMFFAPNEGWFADHDRSMQPRPLYLDGGTLYHYSSKAADETTKTADVSQVATNQAGNSQ